MKVIQLPRQAGKTNKLIEWIKEGHLIDSYPGWSRVILTSTIQEADMIRNTKLRLQRKEFDTYRWVFSFDEWVRAAVPYSLGIEVAIDNVDMLLSYMLRGQGLIKVITLTSDEGIDETNKV